MYTLIHFFDNIYAKLLAFVIPMKLRRIVIICSVHGDVLECVSFRDVIVPVFPGTLLLSQWIATKAIAGKTGTNHIPGGGNLKRI